MTVFPAGRTAVDREQAKKDADEELGGESRRSPLSAAHSLARHCLALLAELEQAEKESTEHFRRSMRLGEELSRLWPLAQEQAKEEWRSNAVDKIPALEARLARVPALVEAVRRIVDDFPRTDMRGRGDYYAENLHQARDIARAALAEWEQA